MIRQLEIEATRDFLLSLLDQFVSELFDAPTFDADMWS